MASKIEDSIGVKMNQQQEFKIGGMATLNGVILQSKNFWAHALRKKDGKIDVFTGKTVSITNKYPWIRKIPILRGLAFLVDAVINAILRSSGNKLSSRMIFLIALTSLVLVGIAVQDTPSNVSRVYALSQVLPLPVFFILIRATTLSAYHGAEHKTISAFEKYGQPTIAEIKNSPRIHVRCGTNLAVPLMFVFGASAWYGWGLFSQMILMSTAIEVFRFVTRNPLRLFAKLYLSGGLLLQRITTKEPSVDQMTVAKVALDNLLKLENMV